MKSAASIAVTVKSAASIAVTVKSSSDVWMNNPCTAIKSIHHTPTCVELFVHRSKNIKPIHGVVMNYTHTPHTIFNNSSTDYQYCHPSNSSDGCGQGSQETQQ